MCLTCLLVKYVLEVFNKEKEDKFKLDSCLTSVLVIHSNWAQRIEPEIKEKMEIKLFCCISLC